MADPFEVRMRFTALLDRLNASSTSAQRAASYALRYKDMDEDLHNCILEQLESRQNSVNNRANIFYFIEQLCEMSIKENHPSFVNMIRRDIKTIVDHIAPNDGSGAANVKVVRKGLPKLEQLSVLDAFTVSTLDAELAKNDLSKRELTPPTTSNAVNAALRTSKNSHTPSKSSDTNAHRLDKRHIEQRIEEDRERHKRLKEGSWFVSGEGSVEADKMWDEASDFGEDDVISAVEETSDKVRVTVEELMKEITAERGREGVKRLEVMP